MGQAVKTHNGRFDLYYRHGWAYLVVYPPAPGGRPVYPEDVRSRMHMLGVPKAGLGLIQEIIEKASRKPEKLVEWPEGEKLASDIEVRISEDAMRAYVKVSPPHKGAAPPLPEDIVKALEDAGISRGIKKKEINRLLLNHSYNEQFLLAEGSPPVDARSAQIKYHFNPNRGKPYLEMDFGRINLKELNFIENKKEDDLLAELLPPVTPKDGHKVTGEVIPAQNDTQEVMLSGGENTWLSPDGKYLYAAAEGNVRLSKGRIIVESVVNVENVDYETGNIYFDGSVVVENGIADGFLIEAGGDVQVGKGVGRARLKAGGNILLKTGINGNGEGRIECGGNLFAKYIESSTVECRGNVFVEEAAMHSKLSVWNHCVLNGRRAEVIASNIIAGGSLWCKKLGGIYEAPTYIDIGVHPDLLNAFRDTKHELEAKEESLEKAEDQLRKLSGKRPQSCSEEKLLQVKSQLEEEVSELRAALPKLHHRTHELREKLKASRKSMLVVEDIMYKGVLVTFGQSEYRVGENGVRKTILKPGPEGISESGFNNHERPELRFE